jgi:hypothetical protein
MKFANKIKVSTIYKPNRSFHKNFLLQSSMQKRIRDIKLSYKLVKMHNNSKNNPNVG